MQDDFISEEVLCNLIVFRFCYIAQNPTINSYIAPRILNSMGIRVACIVIHIPNINPTVQLNKLATSPLRLFISPLRLATSPFTS
jgi:hypothetical protein